MGAWHQLTTFPRGCSKKVSSIHSTLKLLHEQGARCRLWGHQAIFTAVIQSKFCVLQNWVMPKMRHFDFLEVSVQHTGPTLFLWKFHRKSVGISTVLLHLSHGVVRNLGVAVASVLKKNKKPNGNLFLRMHSKWNKPALPLDPTTKRKR